MQERLQKILSTRGVCSRRAAEAMIEAGRVCINGRVASIGDRADADVDDIRIDGVPLPAQSGYVYIMLHKPRGFVTTLSDEKGRANAAALVQNVGVRVYPVGRLDMDSEGLLLFTNDGEFANRLMHPKHEVDKVYETWVTGYTKDAEKRLAQPIELDGYRIKAPTVTLLQVQGDCAKFRITIHEGRNRQVRRMCLAAGMTVTRLRRIQEGTLRLGTLPRGKWRELTAQEIADLVQ